VGEIAGTGSAGFAARGPYISEVGKQEIDLNDVYEISIMIDCQSVAKIRRIRVDGVAQNLVGHIRTVDIFNAFSSYLRI
jgi:hypothetical protein